MSANRPFVENDLVEWGADWLRAHLPERWELDIRPSDSETSGRGGATIEITAQSVYGTLAVDARRSLAPREVRLLFGSVGRTLRTLMPTVSVLVVAPWLSPRTRELLTAEGVNYLDMTGNALIRLDTPALFIQASGANRDPSPPARARASTRGPKAWRLIRALIDARPPYGVRDLAEALSLAPGYVSRLLDSLDSDALIQRDQRGRVDSVDIAGLIRHWATTYDVLRSNNASSFLAPRGADAALAQLAKALGPVAVTGSFAAARLAPVAAPALLAVYADRIAALPEALGLLPADVGANVVVLRPYDLVAWARTMVDADVRYVAPSQAAVDCLTGTGRMPAEGEAVIAWMLEDESRWRADSLKAFLRGTAA